MALIHVTEPIDHVVTITLDRPEKRNALSVELRDEVSEVLDDLAADDAVRTVVVTGAGGTFSAGFDLGEFEVDDPDFQRELWASSDRFHQTWLGFPLPTLAAVDGPALAGGFDLAIMCDLRVASTTARFAHPEQAWGDVVYGPLEALVGGAVARDLALTGRPVEAEEALRLHLVNELVEPERLRDVAQERAAQVARAPRDVLLRMKAKIVRRADVVGAGGTLDL